MQADIEANVSAALLEDLGAGDLTASLIEPQRQALAQVRCRDDAVLCGRPWVQETLRQAAPNTQLTWLLPEDAQGGTRCRADQVFMSLQGPARELLSVERTALNFVQLLSAVATKTAAFVQAVQGTRARIVDTRKTLPGLRVAQKYAVLAGGGLNHRMGLHDAILIEIELETLEQLKEALSCGATMILLDNMPVPMLQEAVRINAGRAVLEISGGVNMATVRELALTGVDRISIGTLTKDIHAVDLSMRIVKPH
jgi:nicotinate-nucleotide pyrophosphorylase (carboxylating)